jgi:hypothetical protein
MVSVKHGLLTVTLNVHVAILFFVSFAVYVTVVEPTLKHKPDWWDVVNVGVPQLSVTVGAIQRAMEQLSALFNEIFAGQFLITGLIVSLKHGLLTVTENVQRVVLPLVSRAV